MVGSTPTGSRSSMSRALPCQGSGAGAIPVGIAFEGRRRMWPHATRARAQLRCSSREERRPQRAGRTWVRVPSPRFRNSGGNRADTARHADVAVPPPVTWRARGPPRHAAQHATRPLTRRKPSGSAGSSLTTGHKRRAAPPGKAPAGAPGGAASASTCGAGSSAERAVRAGEPALAYAFDSNSKGSSSSSWSGPRRS